MGYFDNWFKKESPKADDTGFVSKFKENTDLYPLLHEATAHTIVGANMAGQLPGIVQELAALKPDDFVQAWITWITEETIENMRKQAIFALTNPEFGNPDNPKSFF